MTATSTRPVQHELCTCSLLPNHVYHFTLLQNTASAWESYLGALGHIVDNSSQTATVRLILSARLRTFPVHSLLGSTIKWLVHHPRRPQLRAVIVCDDRGCSALLRVMVQILAEPNTAIHICRSDQFDSAVQWLLTDSKPPAPGLSTPAAPRSPAASAR